MNKDIEASLFNEDKTGLLSFLLIVFSAAIIPLIVHPREVYTWIYPAYILDHLSFYKMLFFLIVSLFMAVFMILMLKTIKSNFKASIPLLLFTLWAGVSTVFAKDLTIALFGYPTRWQGLIIHISYFILFTYTLNMLDLKYFKTVLVCIFVSAAIISVYSIINYYGFDPYNIYLKAFWEASTNPVVIRATLGNRNLAGAYFSLIMPIILFLYLLNKDRKKDIILFIATVLFFAGLIVSLTRVSWIGTFIACVFGFLFIRRDYKKYLKKIILVSVSFFIVIVLLDFTGGRQVLGRLTDFLIQTEILKDEGNIAQFGSHRMIAYKKALIAIKEHPITGVGPESFIFYGDINEEEMKILSLPVKTFFDKVHSDYLEFAATMGIPSMVFYLWFLFSIFIPLVRRKDSIPPKILAVFIGWTAYIVQAAFNINSISVSPVFFVLSAILYKFLIEDKKGSRSKSGNLTSADDGNVDKIALT